MIDSLLILTKKKIKLNWIRSGIVEGYTNAGVDVVKLLHVDENKEYKLLKKLVEQGLLEALYKGRYAKYPYRVK